MEIIVAYFVRNNDKADKAARKTSPIDAIDTIDAIGEIEAIEIIIFKIKFRSDVENMIRLLLLIGK